MFTRLFNIIYHLEV